MESGDCYNNVVRDFSLFLSCFMLGLGQGTPSANTDTDKDKTTFHHKCGQCAHHVRNV